MRDYRSQHGGMPVDDEEAIVEITGIEAAQRFPRPSSEFRARLQQAGAAYPYAQPGQRGRTHGRGSGRSSSDTSIVPERANPS
jgi:hypothetical protein